MESHHRHQNQDIQHHQNPQSQQQQQQQPNLPSFRRYVVLFPFMAQGHLNPFLDFARYLASRIPDDLSIKIISTPANNLKLRPRFVSYPTIDFVELPPFHETIENTDSLSNLSAIAKFYHSSEKLKPSFKLLISQLIQSNGGNPPICIISDMFLGFTVEVAHSFGSRHVPLYTSGPYAMSIYNSIWAHLPHRLTSANVISLPGLPPNFTIQRDQLSQNMIKAAESYTQDSAPTFGARQAEFCKHSDGSLWNTVDVLEKSNLKHWANTSGRPVWAIGPLLPISSTENERGGKIPGLSPTECAQWLSLHPAKSVIYVSFGSQNSIPADRMMELAMGLEKSEKGFIWVLRNPTGFEVADEFRSEWLPPGFEERMRQAGKGLLVRNWCPQIQILSHESTGAFLSHCGWNSILESLSNGIPIIGWPLGSEQYYNSKLLEEELGVCLELARGFNAIINWEDVAELVRLVLEGEKAVQMRKKAEDLSEEMKKALMDNGSSIQALDDFVKTSRKWGEDITR